MSWLLLGPTGVPEGGNPMELLTGLQMDDPTVLTAGLERVDLLLALEGLAMELLEFRFAGLDTEDRIVILLGLETGDFTLQWLGGLEIGDFMLLIGLESGEPTLLTCAGLCNMEPRLSTLGERDRGVPCPMGLCMAKFPKPAVVEDMELTPAGLHTEEAMF